MEVLVITCEYDMHLDVKYCGEKENPDVFKKEFADKEFKYPGFQ